MTTLKGSAQTGASRRSRPRILEAARQIAAGEHDTPLTMEAIAMLAGVTRRTLYNHFANVGDLCLAACAPLFAHCRAALPACERDPRPTRVQVQMVARDVLRFQRDPIHVSLKRTTKLQSLAAPELKQTYGRLIREPLRTIVAARLSGTFPERPGEHLADEVLATLEAVNRLDYLVRDLARAGAGSVVVDMLLDRFGVRDEVRRAA